MKQFLIITIIIFLTGCNGCMHQLYGVNEAGYLNIVFTDSKFSNQYLKSFIDTVLNKNDTYPDSILYKFFSDGKLKNDERIVHFDENPEEWYVVSFDVLQPWIEYIYKNGEIDMIRRRSELSESEIKRIENRFRINVLQKAELFAKENKIPDSIVYEK